VRSLGFGCAFLCLTICTIPGMLRLDLQQLWFGPQSSIVQQEDTSRKGADNSITFFKTCAGLQYLLAFYAWFF
jgi:hypothetical protein